MDGQSGGSGPIRGDTRRIGKKKNNSSLYRVYSFEKAPLASSSSLKPQLARHDSAATARDHTMLSGSLDGTLEVNANSRIPTASISNEQGKQRDVSLPAQQQQGQIDAHYFAPDNISGPVFPIDNSSTSTLDGGDFAPTSFHPPVNLTPSHHVQPLYSQNIYATRALQADNPLLPYPFYRQPLLGQTAVVQEPQVFDQGYQTGYPPLNSERTTSARRAWLQQQQVQDQQQNQGTGLGADAPYQHSPLHPSRSATVSEHQRPSSAFAAPSFSSGVGGSSSTGNENSSMMGMTDASFASSQSGYEGQQARFQDSGGHGQGSIGPMSLQRAHGYQPESSDPGSLGSSEWGSLPNLRLMRGAQGDLLSSNTSISQMSTQSERGRKKQSRAHLQKHLRTLQSEMVALKEKVRVAEDMYRDTSPDERSISEASSGRLYDSTAGRKPMDHFIMRDYRGSERTAQSNSEMVESSGSAYSSSFSGYPASTWRQHPYSGGPSQTASSSSSMGALPPRRGTWKTGAGNVLVFNTAVSSDTDQSSSAQPRTTSFNEQNNNDDAEEDEDVTMGTGGTSDDTGKRYQCLVPGCLKSFTTSGHARRHSRTHLGHKLFVCPHDGCDSTFTRRDNCRQHQRARHHMTLPVPELSEGEALENLILDRQQTTGPHSSRDAANTTA